MVYELSAKHVSKWSLGTDTKPRSCYQDLMRQLRDQWQPDVRRIASSAPAAVTASKGAKHGSDLPAVLRTS
jgi:hypothetical protein